MPKVLERKIAGERRIPTVHHGKTRELVALDLTSNCVPRDFSFHLPPGPRNSCVRPLERLPFSFMHIVVVSSGAKNIARAPRNFSSHLIPGSRRSCVRRARTPVIFVHACIVVIVVVVVVSSGVKNIACAPTG